MRTSTSAQAACLPARHQTSPPPPADGRIRTARQSAVRLVVKEIRHAFEIDVAGIDVSIAAFRRPAAKRERVMPGEKRTEPLQPDPVSTRWWPQMKEVRYDRCLLRIVLLSLAGKSPQEIPVNANVVILGPAQKVDVLDSTDALAHEAQHVGTQRLNTGLDVSDASLRHQFQLLASQACFNLIEEFVARLVLDEHGKQLREVRHIHDVVDRFEAETPVPPGLAGEFLQHSLGGLGPERH